VTTADGGSEAGIGTRVITMKGSGGDMITSGV
jgi:hypothetical protein